VSLTYLSSALDAVHRSGPTDLMRRLVKEDLYPFAGTKLSRIPPAHQAQRQREAH
jgi:hypothetical protein